MGSDAKSTDEYLATLPEDRKVPMTKLYKTIKKNLPRGFEETIAYGMIGWVVPHKLFPAGYHCDPTLPVPFINLASQKNFIAVYHMGLYGSPKLLAWFQDEWKKATPRKLDMGKSCVRFKNMYDIPYDLIGDLASKITPKQWLEHYESALKRQV